MKIFGKTWRIISMDPYETGEVETDLYVLGVFDENDNLSRLVRAGRPSTIRVYEGIEECLRGIPQNKRKYNGTLKPIKIGEGELAE